MNLKNKCAIITGGSEGFGKTVAEKFLREGSNILICARNEKKLFETRDSLLNLQLGKVIAQRCDVACVSDVKAVVDTAYNKFGQIDILVANAGIYGPMGPVDKIDFDEWSYAIDVNLKGVFAQCISVLPYFKKRKSGKIIILSGGGATKPMPYLSAYAASKAAVVRFAETLAHEVVDFNIDVNCVAPGALNTRLLDEVIAAGPAKVGEKFYTESLKQKKNGGNDLSFGANLCAYLASSKSNGLTGKLISAIWDPWPSFSDNIEELKSTDLYTLRRVVTNH